MDSENVWQLPMAERFYHVAGLKEEEDLPFLMKDKRLQMRQKSAH